MCVIDKAGQDVRQLHDKVYDTSYIIKNEIVNWCE